MMNCTPPYAVLVMGLHAAVVILAGCSRTPSPISEAEPLVAVRTVAVEKHDVERTSTQPATVHALYRAEIRAKASGYVKELMADIGDYIAAGDVLAVLDVPEMTKRRQVLEAQIVRCEAEEARAQAGLRLAEATITSARAKVEQAASDVKQAAASLAAAEAEFNRTIDLVQRQSLQDRILDEVRKKRDSEIASRESAESAIRSAEADVAVAEAKRASAAADVAVAQAETEIARRKLEELDVLMDYATIKSPLAGLVTQRTLDPGDLVRQQSEGDAPLFVVSQVDRLRIQIPVPEIDAARVNQGDAIQLDLPSFPAESFATTVTRLSGDLDPSTRTMLVEAEMDNPDGKLLPGMFGQASIALTTKVAADMLPARAIRFDETGNAFVYAVSDEDKISIVEVTTGIDDGNSIEVLSGVSAGQQVVDAHLKRLSGGQKIRRLTN